MMQGVFSKVRKQLTTCWVLACALPRVFSFYGGSLPVVIGRVWAVLKREGVGGLLTRAYILVPGSSSIHRLKSQELYGEMPLFDAGFRPKVSIIVPNFNHAAFLPERLASIYNQTYTNCEVILLDDCSQDESVSILRDYMERYPEKTISEFNAENSGGVFNQWKKGLGLATGELIWIAESDDFCTLNFLEEVV